MAQCVFIKSKRFPGYLTCARGCGIRLPIAAVEGSKIYSECQKTQPTPRPEVPTEGPGTELKKLIKELGFDESLGCGCAAEVARMNSLGPARCREQIESIVAKLDENKKLQSLWSLGSALAIALVKGFPLTTRGLVEEAIRRSELK